MREQLHSPLLPSPSSPPPRAVVLLSGGLDSATVLAIAKDAGYDCFALSFDYGQRHQFELAAARNICAALGVRKQTIFQLDLSTWGGSALTSPLPVPKDRVETGKAGEIPATYVPARNTVFLSLALAWAEVLGAFDLFIGVNAVDYSGYPDCRPEFIEQFERLANLATKAGVEGTGAFRVHTPLLMLSKADIIRKGLSLGVNYALTHSCYDPFPDGAACNRCDACQLRRKGFDEAGQADPAGTRLSE